jgi:hypothetical protein
MTNKSTLGNTPSFPNCSIAGGHYPSMKFGSHLGTLACTLSSTIKRGSRDLNRLREMELVFLDTDNALWPGFITPKNIKPMSRKES